MSRHQRNELTEFKDAFEAFIGNLRAARGSVHLDAEQCKSSVEQNVHRLTEAGRRLEAHFVREALLIGSQHPEYVLDEQTSEMRQEIERKTEILQRTRESLQRWQQTIDGTATAGDRPPVVTLSEAPPNAGPS